MGRTGSRRTPAPPLHVKGAVTADLADLVRLTWLVERAFVQIATTRANPIATRGAARVASAAFWPLLPCALTLQAALTVAPGSRYYLTPERDAVLAVAVRRGTWWVYCHAAARPGTGQGRALRAVVGPALCAAADTTGTTIETAALTPRLARLYTAEFPGTVDVGPAFPTGRRLRRDPRP